MAGNVYEWVQDEYHDDYNGAPNNSNGWCASDCPENASDSNYNASDSTDRVLRGGNWGSDSSSIRSADRITDFAGPSIQSYGYGGRLARSIP